MFKLSEYKQVIFDCDGVILDSNNIKSEAFLKSLEGEDEASLKSFLKYHKENGGISRFVKFEYFFRNIKQQKDYQDEFDDALNRYSQLSFEGLLSSKEITGIRDVLEFLYSQNIDCFVVSGGEQKEVRSVLKHKDLSRYFQGIFGSPRKKEEHLSALDLTKAIYFGDAKSDYMAAMKFDIEFVYVGGASDWEDGFQFCSPRGIKILQNFSELLLS